MIQLFIYTIYQKCVCARFLLVWFDVSLLCSYVSISYYWQKVNHAIDQIPLKQLWRIWINWSHNSLELITLLRQKNHKKSCACQMGIAVAYNPHVMQTSRRSLQRPIYHSWGSTRNTMPCVRKPRYPSINRKLIHHTKWGWIFKKDCILSTHLCHIIISDHEDNY